MDSRLLCTLALAVLLPAPLVAQDAPATPPPAPLTAEAQRELDEQLIELCSYAWSDAGKIQALLDKGANPNARLEMERFVYPVSAVHMAAQLGHARSLRLLLKHGANPKLPDGDRILDTPLLHAVSFRKYLCAKLLLEAATWTPEELAYPLKTAIGLHAQPLADLLLKHGADVNAPLFDGSSILAAAYQVPRGKACLQYLIRKGLNLREPSPNVIIAAEGLVSIGEEGCLELLLEAGFDPNTRDIEGDTLLRAACGSDKKAKVAYLLEQGADPRVTDSYGRSLMERMQENKDICELLQLHADRLNAEGRPQPPPPPTLELSPLMRAVVAKDAAAARRLLAEGAEVDEVQAQTGSTPLLMALIFKDEAMVRLLLEHGADIWKTNKHGGYPLGQAISTEGWYGNKRFCEMLWPSDLQQLNEEQVAKLVTACAFTGAGERLQSLIDAGIVDVQNGVITRALLEAVLGDKIESAQILLKAGVTPFMPSYYGKYSTYDYTYCRPAFRELFDSVREQFDSH